MDIALFPGQQGRQWADTMINLEVRKLVNTANIVGGNHLRDGLARIKFMDDIKSFVAEQFSVARAAKNNDECMQCIQNIRAENDSLLQQSQMLRNRSAQLYAKVELVKEDNKIVGYMIRPLRSSRRASRLLWASGL